MNKPKATDSNSQAWQPPVFETAGHRRPVGAGTRHHGAHKVEPATHLPTAEELAAVQEAARKEAFQKGYDEGMAQAQQQITQWELQLQQIARSLTEPLSEQREQVTASLAQLAMSISKQIIRRELQLNPDQIIAVVREAIQVLPSNKQQVTVNLHPEDAQLLRQVFALEQDQNSSWRVQDDPSVTRGGCIVTTESSRVNAQIEKRISDLFAHVFGDQREPAKQQLDSDVDQPSVADSVDTSPPSEEA